MPSTIADFYAGRSVFVTGGTGFMGKVLPGETAPLLSRHRHHLHACAAEEGDDPKSRVEKLLASKVGDAVSVEDTR